MHWNLKAALTGSVTCGVVLFGGCSGKATSTSNASVSEQVHQERTTLLVHEDGQVENLGVKRYAHSTDSFIQLFPMSAVAIGDHGYVTGFAPAASPAPGVELPPEGLPLSEVVFDQSGRLVSWTPSVP